MRISIKNNIWIKGEYCTAGSKLLKKFKPTSNAFLVDQLLKESFNLKSVELEEFASGTLGKNTLKKLTHPINNTILGGSSTGCALSLVLNDQEQVSIGTDTGGSIRVPALFNNLIGFKPSYGIISRRGVIPLANNLDCVGLLGRKLENIKKIFSIISKKDKNDLTQVNFDLDQNLTFDLEKVLIYKKNNDFYLSQEEKKIIIKEYKRITNSLFYSNLLRLDGRKFNETIEGFKNSAKVEQLRKNLFLKKTYDRFSSGANLILENPCNEWLCLKLKLEKLLINNILVIFCDEKPKLYTEKYTEKEISEIDWKFFIANLLGLPSIIIENILITAPKYSDFCLLNLTENDIDLIKDLNKK